MPEVQGQADDGGLGVSFSVVSVGGGETGCDEFGADTSSVVRGESG